MRRKIDEIEARKTQKVRRVCVCFGGRSHGGGWPSTPTSHKLTSPNFFRSSVGYMAGPLATIYDVYRHEHVTKKIVAPVWVVVISAISLIIGLATYGYNMWVTWMDEKMD